MHGQKKHIKILDTCLSDQLNKPANLQIRTQIGALR